jgi:moderate conductance mechanosensitive channel
MMLALLQVARVVRHPLALYLVLAALMAPPSACGDEPTAEPTTNEAAENARSAPPVKSRGGKPSDAERLARLQRALDADRQQLAELKQKEESPDDEYRDAEKEFEELDRQRSELQESLDELAGKPQTVQGRKLAAQKKDLEPRWQIAKERFDLAIQEHKILREKAAALETKLKREQEAIDQLMGQSQAPPATAPAAAPALPDPKQPNPSEQPAKPASGDAKTGAPTVETATVVPQATSDESEETRAELTKAIEEAKRKQAAAKEYEHRAESVAERLEALRSNIAIEERLLKIARTKTDQALAARGELDRELQRKMAEDPGALGDVWAKIGEADERFRLARAESRNTQNRMNDLQNELNGVQREQIAVLRRAKQTQEEALAAQSQVARLQNPFAPSNLVQWSLNHGPKLLTIMVAMLLLHLLVKLSGRHITQIVARTVGRGTQRERENRAATLVDVFRNAASLAITGGGVLMALDEVGIPIMPLMGGAAVLGLAVAFGAQNLVRDYFSGFMILLEDQYGINDVVKIGDISGSVEKITLRMTVLRDLEGVVHFVPHGSITRVSNLTHGWSRAVVEVNVSYKEDPDYVMSVLMEIAKELRQDPIFGPLILDEAEMLGLDQLGDYAIVIKFVLKTHPLKRWPVRRELLRRIKRRFDELGIEIPFPHRTVYNRSEPEPRRLEQPRAA